MTKIALIDKTGDTILRSIVGPAEATYTLPAPYGGTGGREKLFRLASIVKVKELPDFQLPLYVEAL